MHKKKLAVVLDSFGIGGIPKACNVHMARLLVYYDITLFLKTDKGELYKDIPSGVKKVFVTSDNVKTIILKDLKKFKIFSAISFLFKFLKNRKNIVLCDEIVNKKRGLVTEEEFDAVFAYHGMNLWNLTFSLYRLKGKKKIAWIHGDHPYKGDEIEKIGKVYSQYDRIYCVSQVCKDNFIADFPLLENKLYVFLNQINSKEIIDKSLDALPEKFDNTKINIVTVGRLSPEKGQDLIPSAIAKLVEQDYSVHWYIVGGGEDYCRLYNLAEKNNVLDFITFTGSKENPYTYIRYCDVYVQPSYSECYGLSISEAGILGKAIVATDICGIKPELSSNDAAIFVKPDSQDIANAIKLLIDNPELKAKIEQNVVKIDFSHTTENEKLLEYI